MAKPHTNQNSIALGKLLTEVSGALGIVLLSFAFGYVLTLKNTPFLVFLFTLYWLTFYFTALVVLIEHTALLTRFLWDFYASQEYRSIETAGKSQSENRESRRLTLKIKVQRNHDWKLWLLRNIIILSLAFAFYALLSFIHRAYPDFFIGASVYISLPIILIFFVSLFTIGSKEGASSSQASMGPLTNDVKKLNELLKRTEPEYAAIRVPLLKNLLKKMETLNAPLDVQNQYRYWLGIDLLESPSDNRADNIEQAIGSFQQVSTGLGRSANSFQRARVMHILGVAYQQRIEGDLIDNLRESVNYYSMALEGYDIQKNPNEFGSIQMNLGKILQDLTIDNQSDTSKKIEVMRQIFAASPLIASKLPFNVEDYFQVEILGEELKQLQKNPQESQRARRIEIFRKILKIHPIRESRAAIQFGLAVELHENPLGDRAENLEEAIELYRQSLDVRIREAFPIDWASSLHNLGNAYRERIRGDRMQNLEYAIESHQQALQVRTRATRPEEWVKSSNNLAICYYERIQGDRANNIETAIRLYQQALQVAIPQNMSVEWATAALNLGLAYGDRVRGDRAQNLETALSCYQQALQVFTPTTSPMDWALVMQNSASAHRERVLGDRAQNIENSIAATTNALRIHTREANPIEWAKCKLNLADAYQERLNGDRTQNIEEVITACSQALEVFTPEAHPYGSFRSAYLLGHLYSDRHYYTEAKGAYQTALAAAENLYQAALSKGSQEAELTATNDLYRRAAFAFAKVGDLETAVVTLERGRARGLSETLQRDRANLDAIRQINPELVDRYQSAADTIRLLESTERQAGRASNQAQYNAEAFRQQTTQARQTLQDCLVEIRQIPGYETFLTSPSFADIATTLQLGQPLIYLSHTPDGSMALVLDRDARNPDYSVEDKSPVDITPIWLDDLTNTDLVALFTNANKKGWFDAYENQGSDRTAWLATIDHTLQSLWHPIVAPILRHLSQTKRSSAILIPAGLYGFLPLHAAGARDARENRRYACDFIQFRYAPNALALKAASDIAARTPATQLLAINDPQPTSSSPLPSSGEETAKAVAAFPGRRNWKLLQHEAATPTAVSEALPNYSVAHFSCHGSASFQTPLDSGLLMAHDEVLSLRKLLDLKLQGLRLAILSACETGIPGTKLPDEVISLPTGLLQAGAAGVVSSLWSVADLSTMLLISRFYELWRPQDPTIQPLEPPAALRQAQLWLRDSTGPELVPYVQSSHPELATRLKQAPNKRPFAHPYYWAAFTYTGV